MMVDFTDLHVRRIRYVEYNGHVTAGSLPELAEKAVEACSDFFGDVEFTITALTASVLIQDVRTGEARLFNALFSARLAV